MLTLDLSSHRHCLQPRPINMSIYLARYIQELGESFYILKCFINVMGGAFYIFPGLPYSMKQAGFPLGILLLFGVSYVTGKILCNCFLLQLKSCNDDYTHTHASTIIEFSN